MVSTKASSTKGAKTWTSSSTAKFGAGGFKRDNTLLIVLDPVYDPDANAYDFFRHEIFFDNDGFANKEICDRNRKKKCGSKKVKEIMNEIDDPISLCDSFRGCVNCDNALLMKYYKPSIKSVESQLNRKGILGSDLVQIARIDNLFVDLPVCRDILQRKPARHERKNDIRSRS
jgi:hypothetical protein